MAPLFSQRFCSVVPYRADGVLVAGRKMHGCLVQILDGDLFIIAGNHLVDRAPVSSVQLDTPALQRKVGGGTLLRMNGNQWAIDFGNVGTAEIISGGGAWRKVRVAFGAGTFKNVKRARQVNREFVAALLGEGAANLRPSG